MPNKKSTLTHEWQRVADAAGGVEKLSQALGFSTATFYRVVRGQVKMTPEKRMALEIYCNRKQLPNPLITGPKPWERDLTALRLHGEALAKGFPSSRRDKAQLRMLYPETQLVKLAEADAAPDAILRACQDLLEPDE